MLVPHSVLLLKSQNADDGPDEYETQLKQNKFEVQQVKTLIFNFKNLQTLTEKLKNSDQYSGIILSSPRCVQAVHMASSDNNFLQQWKEKHNFVVGEATHKVALEKLGLDGLGKEAGNAANLSKVILEKKLEYSKPFLFPHGNLKTDTLNLELGKEGLEIDGIEVYDTVANPDFELDLSKVTNNYQIIPEYVVFFSPSGFSSSIDYIKKVPVDLNEIKFVAIGPVTELAITEKGLQVYGVAKRPTPEQLLNVILDK